jgi:hypothetical protein
MNPYSRSSAKPPHVCDAVTRFRHAAVVAFLLMVLATTSFSAIGPSITAGDQRTQQSIDAENAYVLATPSGIVRHLSPSGSDCTRCGTPSSPYKTLAYAVGQLRPGDTLYGHAVSILSNSHSITLRNNLISDSTGDGLQCSGPLQGYVPGSRPYDIL